MHISFLVHCRMLQEIFLESRTSWATQRQEHRQDSQWVAGSQELINNLRSHLNFFLFNTGKYPKVRLSLILLKDTNCTHSFGDILVRHPNLTLSIAVGFDHLLLAGKKLASEQWPLWQMAQHRLKRDSQKYSFPRGREPGCLKAGVNQQSNEIHQVYRKLALRISIVFWKTNESRPLMKGPQDPGHSRLPLAKFWNKLS